MSDQITNSDAVRRNTPAFLRDADFIELHGKRPVRASWTTDPSVRFGAAEAMKRIAAGKNVGVVLGPRDLVLDVDPRNGGKESWDKLKTDLNLSFAGCGVVRTGSGGLHIYMRVPEGAGRLKGNLAADGYRGIDVKHFGGQVVAPGSVHPETGRAYEVHQDLDPLDELDGLPEAPEALMQLLSRPQDTVEQAPPGSMLSERLAAILDKLDVGIYRGNHAGWLELMMACHDATGGAGCAEFVDWSISDPEYSGDAEIIARRWDSLGSHKGPRVTAATLRKHLADAGVAHLIEPDLEQAVDDFESIDPLEEEEVELPHAVSATKAKREANARKARQAKAEKGKLRKLAVAASQEEYARWLNATFVYDRSCGKRVNVKTGEPMDDQVFENEHGPGWSRSGGKGTLINAIKTAKAGIELRSVMMAASFPGRERFVAVDMGTHSDQALNTWYDTTLPPVQGDHGWFKAEVERLFPGDERQQSILLDYWAARCLEPGRKVRWQLVMESAQGVGKGSMKSGFETLFGWRNTGTFGTTQLRDKFNAWMVSAANLFGEEIGFSTWKEAKDAYECMKAPITDDFIAVRPMQRESQVRVPNGTNYVVNRNPSGKFYCPSDDRRICYLRPNPDDVEEKGAHYQALHRHYASRDDMAAVRWWLENVWAPNRLVTEQGSDRLAGVGAVRYDGDPPMTDAKRALMRDCLRADNEDALDFGRLEGLLDGQDLFTADDALRLARDQGLDRFDATDDQLRDAIRKWLKAAGFQKHPRHTHGQGLQLYSPPADVTWSAMGRAERERAYLERA